MKSLNILLLLVMTSFSYASAQLAFSNVSFDKFHKCDAISFSVPSETNVYQYRILGGNDSTDLTIIGTMHPTGNCMLTKKYNYVLCDTPYAYYCVQVVGMDSKTKSSRLVATKVNVDRQSRFIDQQYNANGSIVLKSH